MFPTTHPSAVQGVGSPDAKERERSWEALVQAYWKPAYKHLRVKWKQTPAAAEDTVQSFFAKAVERAFFSGYDPGKARFRTFFKLCLDRHQAHERKRVLTVDFSEAEAELSRAARVEPDDVFDREWKRVLFGAALEQLKATLDPVVYRVFEAYDLCEGPRPRYEDLARHHGLPVTTITNHLSRARRALREQVQARLAQLEEEL